MAEGQFTSTERVYADKDGNRVDAKDPKRHTLVVAEGGSIPMERARELGLVKEEAGEAESPGEAEGEAEGGGAIDAKAESARVQGKASKKAGKKAAK